jgi:hypothetical protein
MRLTRCSIGRSANHGATQQILTNDTKAHTCHAKIPMEDAQTMRCIPGPELSGHGNAQGHSFAGYCEAEKLQSQILQDVA